MKADLFNIPPEPSRPSSLDRLRLAVEEAQEALNVAEDHHLTPEEEVAALREDLVEAQDTLREAETAALKLLAGKGGRHVR